MPGINDDPEQIARIVDSAEQAGVESIDALPLHLRGSTKQVFMDWLERTRPELVHRYRELYGEGSEMAGAEQRRLMELVKPRGRTWDDRIRERKEQEARLGERMAATKARTDQLELF